MLKIEEYESNKNIKDIYTRFPNIHIYAIKNKGMDIGPFLQMLNIINNKNHITHNKEYNIFLKLHTKTDKLWRKKILDDLLNKDSINKIISLLNKYEIIGSHVVPYDYYNNVWISYMLNELKKDHPLIHTFKIKYIKPNIQQSKHVHKDKRYSFAAGTCFWFNRTWFLRCISLIVFYKYLNNGKQIDTVYQQPEHAMERLFGIIADDKITNVNRIL